MTPFSLRHYQRDTTTHHHDYAQLVMPIDGALDIEVAGKAAALNVGQACIILPGERHDFAADPKSAFLVHDSQWLPDGVGEQVFITLDATQRAYLSFVQSALAHGRSLLGMGELWLSLLAAPNGVSARIRRVQRHIELHLGASLGSRELAAEACLGLSQFNQRFRRELGMSPQHYVQQRRLAMAARLLIETGLPVSEVAARVGYDNPSAFAERFAREYGFTPSRWRQRNDAANGGSPQ